MLDTFPVPTKRSFLRKPSSRGSPTSRKGRVEGQLSEVWNGRLSEGELGATYAHNPSMDCLVYLPTFFFMVNARKYITPIWDMQILWLFSAKNPDPSRFLLGLVVQIPSLGHIGLWFGGNPGFLGHTWIVRAREFCW